MSIQNKVLEYFPSSIKALPFAKWAKPKQTELNLKRTRTLCENSEVIWDIGADGAKVSDHIEMAGYYVSAVISYGSDENGELRLMRHITVPMLRLKPNLTASSFSHNFTSDSFTVTQNSKKIVETPYKVIIKGSLKIISHSSCNTEITRELLPAINVPALIEKVTVKNCSDGVKEYAVSAKSYVKKTPDFICIGGSIFAESSVCFDSKFERSQNRQKKYTLKDNYGRTFRTSGSRS